MQMTPTVVANGPIYLGHHNHPGYYVTPAGRVYSERSDKMLKPSRMGEYVGVTIPDSTGRFRKRYIHRLVLEFVTGVLPTDMECRHLDGDRTNNSIDNLCWGTPKENAADKARHGTSSAGERNGMAVLSWSQVREIRALAASMTGRQLALEFNVSPMTISRIINNQAWRHV